MAMEAEDLDNLDNLIADSLSGVQSALETEKKASEAKAEQQNNQRSAGDVVKELHQGPAAADAAANEEFFANLLKTFQDDDFQKTMSDTLAGSGDATNSSDDAAPAKAEAPDVEDFLQNFLKTFEGAVENDDTFAKSMTSMMTSMLNNDLICEPLQQIAEKLEPRLSGRSLPAAERTRYEAQLALYKKIIEVYKGSPDPLPDPAREEVQRLLAELHTLGQPPDEVMREIAPKDGAPGAVEDSFEDFMKSMGLADGLGSAEQDLLKKLSENPEELTKVMQEMASELKDSKPDEACKQQ